MKSKVGMILLKTNLQCVYDSIVVTNVDEHGDITGWEGFSGGRLDVRSSHCLDIKYITRFYKIKSKKKRIV